MFKLIESKSGYGGELVNSKEKSDIGPEMSKGSTKDVLMFIFDESNFLNIPAIVAELYNFSKKYSKSVIVKLDNEMIEIDAASGSKKFVLLNACKKINDYITKKAQKK